ncbi:hypothetical protein HDU93_002135, partial [Gonapodya sp. JEL0774]
MAKEHEKLQREAQEKLEEQREMERIERERQLLEEKYRLEREEEARQEALKAAGKGKDGGDGPPKRELNKKEQEEEARRKLEEAHVKAKEEAERLKKEKRMAKFGGGQAPANTTPAHDPVQARPSSPPIPTLRNKDNRPSSPPIPTLRSKDTQVSSPPPPSAPVSSLQGGLAAASGQQRLQYARPSTLEDSSQNAGGSGSGPPRLPSGGSASRRQGSNGMLLKQLESIKEELQRVQEKVQKDLKKDDARARARNLELGDPYLAIAETTGPLQTRAFGG